MTHTLNMKLGLAAIAIAVSLAFNVSSAEASTYCVNQYRETAEKTQRDFEPQFSTIRSELKRVQDAGLNPEHYFVVHDGEMLSLVQVANKLAVQFSEEMGRAAGESEGCMAAVAPANILVNGSIKLYAVWATYGIALLLPEEATYVDMGEIAHGKIFGGSGAIVPQIRELILNGDNGTIANFIRDPWKCISFQRKC